MLAELIPNEEGSRIVEHTRCYFWFLLKDGYPDVPLPEVTGQFQTDESSPDNDGFAQIGSCAHNCFRVVNVAKGDDSFCLNPGYLQGDGGGTRGD